MSVSDRSPDLFSGAAAPAPSPTGMERQEPRSPSEVRMDELAQARAWLEGRGFRIRSFAFSDCPITRYTVTGYPGSFLPVQIVGLARQRGWEPVRATGRPGYTS